MLLMMIINVILAVGVMTMVLTPLVWAIRTQHRDRPGREAIARATPRRPDPQPHRPSSRPRTPRPAVPGRA